MLNAKDKGTAFEYEIRNTLKYLDDTVRRTVMSGAIGQMLSSEMGDIATDIGLCIECKRTERLQPYAFFEQAAREKHQNDTPVVAMRSNNKPALALLSWSDFVEIYEHALLSGYRGKTAFPKKVENRKITEGEKSKLRFSKISNPLFPQMRKLKDIPYEETKTGKFNKMLEEREETNG